MKRCNDMLAQIGVLKKCQIVEMKKNKINYLYKDSMILSFYFEDGKLVMEGIPIKQPKIEGF